MRNAFGIRNALELFKKELFNNRIYMARRRYYRARRVYPKQKYSSLMKSTNSTQTLTSGQTEQISAYDLVSNSVESATPAPTIIKFARVKMTGTVSTTVPATSIGNLYYTKLFVMYCPQSYTYDSFSKITAHPEYIIAHRDLTLNPAQRTSFTMSSRLKRNLNSGDKIQYVIVVGKESSLVGAVSMVFDYQYYVRNN